MKTKETKREHEEKYILFLEKQIKWHRDNPNKEDEPKVNLLKYRLSKARLILKTL